MMTPMDPSGVSLQFYAKMFSTLNGSGTSIAAVDPSGASVTVSSVHIEPAYVSERSTTDFRLLFDEFRPANVSLPMLRSEWRLSKREEDLVKHLLPKLVKEGTLAISGKRGISTAYSYTKDLYVTRDVSQLSDDLVEFPVFLPLGVQRVGYIDNHSLILAHAPTGNGKSLLAHNIIQMNMRHFGKEGMRYIETEMGASCLTRKFRGMGITKEIESEFIDTKTNVRLENIPLILLRDGLNIVDYYSELASQLFAAAEYMRTLKDALGEGIVILFMQTNPKTKEPYGGDFAKFEPALIISKEWDTLKVTKIRESKMEEPSPLGWQRSYTVKNGLMVPVGKDWEKIVKK